jgi:deoxyribodipyrimidine photolyase-related protein
MSQYGDGGIVGSNPYCASGHYINRMSNFCKVCPYVYDEVLTARACPFTVLYWDFLDRNYDQLREVPRMWNQLRNLTGKRKDRQFTRAIRSKADEYRKKWSDG